ncbi:MAG: hypothetical protein ABW224_01270 [Kibdelosporangium sp.]
MQKNKLVGAGIGLVLAFGLSAGAGLAQAAPSTGAAQAGRADTTACTAAKQQVSFAQARVTEATATRGEMNKQVTSQKSARQTAINAGDVEAVGRFNVQLGSSTAMYTTMDSAVTVAQAQVVRNQAAKKAAC